MHKLQCKWVKISHLPSTSWLIPPQPVYGSVYPWLIPYPLDYPTTVPSFNFLALKTRESGFLNCRGKKVKNSQIFVKRLVPLPVLGEGYRTKYYHIPLITHGWAFFKASEIPGSSRCRELLVTRGHFSNPYQFPWSGDPGAIGDREALEARELLEEMRYLEIQGFFNIFDYKLE